MILEMRILLISIELMMNGKIKQGLSSSSKRNCKYLLKLLTVLDFPEAKVKCFSRFVILPANRQEMRDEMMMLEIKQYFPIRFYFY